MNIVQIITRMDTVGGAQKHVEALALKLKEDRHEVTIVTGSYDATLWRLQQANIPVICAPSLQRAIHLTKDIQALWQIRKIIKKIRPQIIATHSTKAGIVGRIVGMTLRVPSIFTAHSWSFTEGVPNKKRVLYHYVEKIVTPITSKIITVSEYDRRLALSKKIAPAHKLVTVHNGIEQYTSSNQESNDVECPTIVMVARFEEPKRQQMLVEALAELTHVKWQLHFVGDGSLRSDVENVVEKNDLVNQVHFLGNQLNVDPFLDKSQLFVLLSDWEGLPISIIEAMRAGLPIIATDVGGVNELVIEGENGFLIPRNDRKLLKARLTQLLKDSALRKKMSDASERHFLRNFTFTPMYRKTLQLYEEASIKKR